MNMDIFGGETITVGGESPDISGQEEQTAVSTEGESTEEPEYTDNSEQVDDEQNDEDDHESPDDAGQEEWFVPGKFKTPQDMHKAYNELQRKFTQERQTKGQAQQPTTPQPAVPQQSQEQLQEAFWNAFQTNPQGTLAHLINAAVENVIAQRVEPLYQKEQNQVFESNFTTVAKQYPQLGSDEGMQSFAEKLEEIAEEMGRPDLLNNPTPRMMQMAAHELWGQQSRSQIYEQAKKAAREEQERNRRTKSVVGAPKAGARKGADPAPQTEEDEIKAGIMSFSRGGGILG